MLTALNGSDLGACETRFLLSASFGFMYLDNHPIYYTYERRYTFKICL